MGQLARRLENDQYTIILDPQSSLATTIGQATDTKSKWFQSFADLIEEHKNNPIHALAFFVNLNVFKSDPRVLPSLKDTFPVCPVFVLTESSSEELTEAMALGADDFLLTPIEPSILKLRFLVRKAAIAKRASRDSVTVGDLTIDTVSRTVSSPKTSKFFSNIEIRLISLLAQNFGKVVTREALKAYGWPNLEVTDNALNRKLYEIRHRINILSSNVNIRTLYGVGFILEKMSLLDETA